MDVAHLGHVELLTPTPEESRRFFVDVMGMTESGRRGNSVYLRGWDDYERYSLQLTASDTSGLGHAAFRTHSPQALERRVAALRANGHEVWEEKPASWATASGFRFRDPDGHVFELYYDTEWYQAPPELRPGTKEPGAALSLRAASTSAASTILTAWPSTCAPAVSSSSATSACAARSGSSSTRARRLACG